MTEWRQNVKGSIEQKPLKMRSFGIWVAKMHGLPPSFGEMHVRMLQGDGLLRKGKQGGNHDDAPVPNAMEAALIALSIASQRPLPKAKKYIWQLLQSGAEAADAAEEIKWEGSITLPCDNDASHSKTDGELLRLLQEAVARFQAMPPAEQLAMIQVRRIWPRQQHAQGIEARRVETPSAAPCAAREPDPTNGRDAPPPLPPC